MSTAHDGHVTARGLRFHYVERGLATRPPVLCLHGITQTAHSWDEVAAELASAYRVLCLDQRGHGDSDWAPDGDYSRQTQAADVDAISDALGLSSFILAGMSMGGVNAITFTARHPEKVQALVIVDVSPEIQFRGELVEVGGVVVVGVGGRADPVAVAVAALVERNYVMVRREPRRDEIEPVAVGRAAVHADENGLPRGAEILVVEADAADLYIPVGIRGRLRPQG